MTPLRIAFVRPRLGVGGSERLVIDAARELQARGHRTTVFAPGVAGAAQFDEVARGSISLRDGGGWLPSSFAGRLRAPCAIARAGFALLAALRTRPDVLFFDVVAHLIPLARRLSPARRVFYCHYPDSLLTREGARASAAYAGYRRPLDAWEAAGLRAADRVLVNSSFTGQALRAAFPDLELAPRVVHPAVTVGPDPGAPPRDARETWLLSVARFDPRKNLVLAIEALAELRNRLPPARFAGLRLTLAGHLELGWAESRRVLEDLRQRAAALGLLEQVRFEVSPNDETLGRLMRQASLVLYTPAAEHFGYVPLEAMAAGRPVVAVRGGGPAETIRDGETGFLCEPSASAFAVATLALLDDPERATRIGASGRRHAADRFSLARFADELESALRFD